MILFLESNSPSLSFITNYMFINFIQNSCINPLINLLSNKCTIRKTLHIISPGMYSDLALLNVLALSVSQLIQLATLGHPYRSTALSFVCYDVFICD